MVARGRVWLLGGMHGCQGACMVAGGACMVVGGCAWLTGGVRCKGGVHGDRSMHGKGGACVANGGMW